jgi:hypothetical protein
LQNHAIFSQTLFFQEMQKMDCKQKIAFIGAGKMASAIA